MATVQRRHTPRRFHVKKKRQVVEVTGAAPEDVELGLLLVKRLKNAPSKSVTDAANTLVAVYQRNTGDVRQASRLEDIMQVAEHRNELLNSDHHLTYMELATLRGLKESAARSWVHRHRDKILAPTLHGHVVLPAFQFTPHGDLRPDVAEINTILKGDPAKDDWSRWAWWHSRTSFLSGEAPLDVIDQNLNRVRTAARRMSAPPAA